MVVFEWYGWQGRWFESRPMDLHPPPEKRLDPGRLYSATVPIQTELLALSKSYSLSYLFRCQARASSLEVQGCMVRIR